MFFFFVVCCLVWFRSKIFFFFYQGNHIWNLYPLSVRPQYISKSQWYHLNITFSFYSKTSWCVPIVKHSESNHYRKGLHCLVFIYPSVRCANGQVPLVINKIKQELLAWLVYLQGWLDYKNPYSVLVKLAPITSWTY